MICRDCKKEYEGHPQSKMCSVCGEASGRKSAKAQKASINNEKDKMKQIAMLDKKYTPERRFCIIYNELGILENELHEVTSGMFDKFQSIMHCGTGKKRKLHKTRMVLLPENKVIPEYIKDMEDEECEDQS